jgi:hypothetical protein
MKKILLISFSLFIALSSYAQLPDGSIAPDFTATDINGISHNLYDYLDAGYTVIIDISATWCPPCWTYHVSCALKDLWENHGPEGAPGVSANTTNDVIVLYIEDDPYNDQQDLEGTGDETLGDWTEGTYYPIIDNTYIGDLLEIILWPTVYTICPNRTINLTGTLSAEAHYEALSNCPEIEEGNNAALGYNESIITAMECNNFANGNVSIEVQNMGTEQLTNFTIEVVENGVTLANQEYSGNPIDVFETVVINFGNITFVHDEYDIVITTEDDNMADNSITNSITYRNSTDENTVRVTIITDNYPEDTSWELKTSDGTILGSFGPYQGNGANSGGPDALETFTYDIALPEGIDCYKLNIYDSYGDGLEHGPASGYGVSANGVYLISDFESTNFGTSISAYFDAESDGLGVISEISELSNVSISTYPNPVSSNATVEISTIEKLDGTLNVIDVLGKTVQTSNHSLNTGKNKLNINTENLMNGVYFVQLTFSGATLTQKITVSK